MKRAVTISVLALALGGLAGAGSASASTPQQADLAELMLSYNPSNGLIGNSWWQSAVAVSTVEAYQQATGDTSYSYAITNAFTDNEGGNFENDAMDDTGWWGNAWLTAYNMTGNTQYLQMAETDANYIHQYWDSTCGGGLWWTTAETYKNAIPNELFLELTAGLHNAIPGDTQYLSWANAEWSWFSASGMINSSNLINDGLNIDQTTGQCTNNGQTTWTYNQGVILAGLAQLYIATGNTSLLTEAEKIANAAILGLSTNGVLTETCEISSNCDTDQESFKGIFVRGLKELASVAAPTQYASFFENQARSIEAYDTNSNNQLGLQWAGPIDTLTSYSQASAEDAVVASLGLGSSGTIFSGVSASLCMDDSNSGTTDGGAIQIYTCNSSNAQSWTVSGSTLQVMGGCATVSNGGTRNGTKIIWHTCTGSAAQVWQPQSNGELKNPKSGKCLNDPASSTTPGTQLKIYTCSGSTAQQWSIP
jgi:predicted alpha-1,6-mannanase (GH76 family)